MAQMPQRNLRAEWASKRDRMLADKEDRDSIGDTYMASFFYRSLRRRSNRGLKISVVPHD